MEEAECNRREESKILTVLGYSSLSFKFITYIEKSQMCPQMATFMF